MKPVRKSIIYAIALCILYYLSDSVLYYLNAQGAQSFHEVLITNPPFLELISRFIGMLIILFAAIYLQRKPVTVTGKQVEQTTPETVKKTDLQITSDPDLLVNLSFQIKTPLSAILGFSELLKDPNLSGDTRKIYLHYISSSGKYLLELINNITDIARIETRQLPINKTGCNLNKLLSDIYEYYSGCLTDLGKKNINLILHKGIEDENFILLTDQERLSQILHNLLENSVSFTDEGSIEFGYRTTDDLFLEFYVKDTGAGFGAERLETIMERFKSITDNAMRPFDTAALRINISKHLIKMLGGTMQASSKLWEGSTFTFTVPHTEIQVHRHDTFTPPLKKVHLWKEKQILIAEDVKSNFIYLKEILFPTGVQIEWAKNGMEAVEICTKNNNIQLVLMDILMPIMDGYEAARRIKQTRPELPVIAQTAYTLEEDDYKEYHSYFDKYMIKPIWSHDLLATLSQYLD